MNTPRLTLFTAAALAFALPACDDRSETEKAIDEFEGEIEQLGDNIEDATDKPPSERLEEAAGELKSKVDDSTEELRERSEEATERLENTLEEATTGENEGREVRDGLRKVGQGIREAAKGAVERTGEGLQRVGERLDEAGDQ